MNLSSSVIFTTECAGAEPSYTVPCHGAALRGDQGQQDALEEEQTQELRGESSPPSLNILHCHRFLSCSTIIILFQLIFFFPPTLPGRPLPHKLAFDYLC